MSGKVYVAFTENHDYTSVFHGVFSTVKRARAVFEGIDFEDWKHHREDNQTFWLVNDDDNYCDYVIYKTYIDDVIGYIG